MQIEKNGANWKVLLSDRELSRILIALDCLTAADREFYKDEAVMRDLIRATRRFEFTGVATTR